MRLQACALAFVTASCWRGDRATAPPPPPAPDAAVFEYACYTWTRDDRRGTACTRAADCEAHRDRNVAHANGASHGSCKGTDSIECFHGLDTLDGSPDGADWCFATGEECERAREASSEFAMTSDWHCTANP